jgi:hypothetical protein
MREFEHPNLEGFQCPICGMSTDAPVVLIPIQGAKEGDIMQVQQVHSHCVEYVLTVLIASEAKDASN